MPCPWAPPVSCLRPLTLGPIGQPIFPPESLATLARLSALVGASTHTLALRFYLGRRSTIERLRIPRTPSHGRFVKETLDFLEINPSSLVFARRPLSFCRKAPDLLVYRRNRPSFVFWIPKLVYFISFSYELQIGWFKLQNVHKIFHYLHVLILCLGYGCI
jgi:hypothetical protein